MAKSPPPQWRKTYLREWRERAGMTLEGVSPQIELSHSQLSRIERGQAPYSQRVLEMAAVLYGCSVLDLLTRPPGEGEEIFSIWGDLNEAQKNLAIRVFRATIEDE